MTPFNIVFLYGYLRAYYATLALLLFIQVFAVFLLIKTSLFITAHQARSTMVHQPHQ